MSASSVLAVVLALISVPLWATQNMTKEQIYSNFSLFYTDDELVKQEATRQHDTLSQPGHKIHLQALFYADAQTWTLWINGHQFTATASHTLYKIHRITSHYVVLDWWYEGKMHRIQLQPNQSYDALSGQVSEGG